MNVMRIRVDGRIPMNIIIFGYGQEGIELYRELKNSDSYSGEPVYSIVADYYK